MPIVSNVLVTVVMILMVVGSALVGGRKLFESFGGNAKCCFLALLDLFDQRTVWFNARNS